MRLCFPRIKTSLATCGNHIIDYEYDWLFQLLSILHQLTSFVRFCEFGRAMAMRNLGDSRRPVHYFGFVLAEFETNMTAIKTAVYNEWDTNSARSPPKTRPREESDAATSAPDLQIFSWQSQKPVFPSALMSRFQEGTAEFAKMVEFKKTFNDLFPESAQPTVHTGVGRVGGACDFTLDSNRCPLDIHRVIDLPTFAVSEFSERRPGFSRLISCIKIWVQAE